jgi:hypothetical protein
VLPPADAPPFLEPQAASTAAATPATMKPRRLTAGAAVSEWGFMALSLTGPDECRLRIQ